VASPKKKARRNTSKGSSMKGPGGTSGGMSAGDQQRNDAVPVTDILREVGSIPAPVASELAGFLSSDQISPDELSMPVYGNYCGMGHGDPTGKTPPIDAVDAVCREHDMCYESLGDFEPWCDLELIGSMPDAIADTPSPLGKQAGVLTLLYFSLAERNLALGETLFKKT
jgi:hypothetical protein